MNAIAENTGIILDIHQPPNGEAWGTNVVNIKLFTITINTTHNFETAKVVAPYQFAFFYSLY